MMEGLIFSDNKQVIFFHEKFNFDSSLGDFNDFSNTTYNTKPKISIVGGFGFSEKMRLVFIVRNVWMKYLRLSYELLNLRKINCEAEN